MVTLMENNCEAENIEIGDRIEVGGYRGTVLYIGPVDNTNGIWLGVDWDDPNRGKHNGSYSGVRYFQARYETSGSLVRLEKVVRGRSIIAAIKEKYGSNNNELDKEIVEEVQRAINAPFLMMVGFDKVSEKQSFESLTVVNVRNQKVSNPGEDGQLGELCPGIVELDLGCNLIKSWKSVADITSQLPYLKFIDLSENRLSLDCDFEEVKNNFLQLEYLVLSKVEFNWDNVLQCCSVCPKLEKLQVSFNNITSLKIPSGNILQNLKMLNIEGNNIVNWSEFNKLGYIPGLEVLNASNTGLTSVFFSSPNNLFPKLKYILLSGNYINNWESISELEKLPQLNELKFRGNPILNDISSSTARQILIARLSKLTTLNGQEIPDEERRGAEIDYLKQNGKMWLDAANSLEAKQSFLIVHPRYPDLIKKFGEVSEGELKVQLTTLKSKLKSVKFVNGEKEVCKRLPEDMSIQRLYALAQRLFNTGSALPKLTLVSYKNPLVQTPLENGLKMLSYYSIEEGDTVIVN